jgi:hypothetical protein
LFDLADHLVVPVMRSMDPEDAHKLSILIAKHLPLICPRVSTHTHAHTLTCELNVSVYICRTWIQMTKCWPQHY